MRKIRLDENTLRGIIRESLIRMINESPDDYYANGEMMMPSDERDRIEMDNDRYNRADAEYNEGIENGAIDPDMSFEEFLENYPE